LLGADFHIVIGNAESQPDALDFSLAALNRLFFFLFPIKKFSIIHQPAYRRVNLFRNLNKIKAAISCHLYRLFEGKDA